MLFLRIGSAALLTIFAFTGAQKNKENVRTDRHCDGTVFENAIRDYGTIKPGTLRKDIEKSFHRGGGIQFRGNSRYTYNESDFMHVDVEFRTSSTDGNPFAEQDVVVGVSKLYIDYEPRD